MVHTGRQLPTLQLPGLDYVEQTCWHEFLDSSMRLLAVLDSRLNAAHGLTLSEVRFLNLLAISKAGAARKSELCHALMMPPGRLAQIFRHLRGRGLVAQSATPHDRRGILLSITDVGRARAAIAQRTLSEEVRMHFLERMSHPQMLELIDSHRRIKPSARVGASTDLSESDLTACE